MLRRLKILFWSTIAACLALMWVSAISWAIITSGTLQLQSGTGTAITFQTNGANTRGQVTSAGSFVLNNGNIASNATDGYVYLPTTSGAAPTGVPTTVNGTACVFDTFSTPSLYCYAASAWKRIGPAAADSFVWKFSGRALGTATGYFADEGTATAAALNPTALAYPAPACTTWGNLYINVITNGLSTNATFTVLKNGVAQTPTLTIVAAATGIQADNANTFSSVAGDTIDFQMTGGTVGTVILSGTLQCQP